MHHTKNDHSLSDPILLWASAEQTVRFEVGGGTTGEPECILQVPLDPIQLVQTGSGPLSIPSAKANCANLAEQFINLFIIPSGVTWGRHTCFGSLSMVNLTKSCF